MKRDPDSHKGENGKVAVIGGSRLIHGAPIFSALAAEAGGADLIYVCAPACHEDVTKNASLNFQVHAFDGDELLVNDCDAILELLASMDCAVIGPGLSTDKKTLDAISELVDGASCPLVLDATALQPMILKHLAGKSCVLTPHLGELERLGIAPDAIGGAAKEYDVTILRKGKEDVIATPDGRTKIVEGGNAGLTVGGTGDALAGLVASLVAQHMSTADACEVASTVVKKAGDQLFETQGFAYTTSDVIKKIPEMLKKLS